MKVQFFSYQNHSKHILFLLFGSLNFSLIFIADSFSWLLRDEQKRYILTFPRLLSNYLTLYHIYLHVTSFYECLEFIRPLDNEGKHSGPKPSFPDVFRLYASLKTGMTMKDWCKRMSPRQYNVDERRVIQFGVCHGFVRKLCVYPVSLKKGDLRRIAKLCDGTRSLEDLAVVFAVSPVKLLEAIRDDGNFVFISK